MNFMLDFPPVLNLVRGHNRDISIDNQKSGISAKRVVHWLG